MAMLPMCNTALGQSVLFSHPGGFYSDTFYLGMEMLHTSTHGPCTIHYTLNGAVPTACDSQYKAPLPLSSDCYSMSALYKVPTVPEDRWFEPSGVEHIIVVRAAAFDSTGEQCSPVTTQSYLIDSLLGRRITLPVVSLCTDSLSLFDHDTGIFVKGYHFEPRYPYTTGNYFQRGRWWEREASFTLYDTSGTILQQNCGLRVHGNSQRVLAQKGLSLYARADYGVSHFVYPFFGSHGLARYKRLTLRPWCASWSGAGIEDWLCQQLARPLLCDNLDSRPVVLFLNGEYWGIYFIEEKVDERYIESHFDVDGDRVNIIEAWDRPECGSSDDFKSLFLWLETADLSDTAQYRELSRRIDIPNIIDYFIFELFSTNWDWPGNNARCWQNPGGPWQWVFYDGDCCLDNLEYDVYMMATFTGKYWSTGRSSTLFFRKLLESKIFKNQFLLRLAQLNKTRFSYRETKPQLDNIIQLLKDEIPMQAQRFHIPQSVEQWEESCRKLDQYLSERGDKFWQQTTDYFHLSNDKVLSVVSRTDRTFSTKRPKLAVTAEEYCVALMEIIDPHGDTIHTQYLFLHQGENKVPIKLGKRSGVYVVKVGNAVCEITRISYAIPIAVLLSAVFLSVLLVFLTKRRKRVSLLLFCLPIPCWLQAQDSELRFSPEGGVYAVAFPVTIACDNPNVQIRYTLDGGSPDRNAMLYSGPLTLNSGMRPKSDIYKIPISPDGLFYLPDSVVKGIVIRAAAFDNSGNRVSPVVTQSYFIGSIGCDLHGLPVVSLCADSLALFDHDTGILVPGALFDPEHVDLPGNYSQHGRDWEREVNVEFYDAGNKGFNQTAGLRTHGGPVTRRAQQKGLKIYAREEYGQKNFKYRIFEESPTDKFKHLILRPFSNSCTAAGIQDWLANHIAGPLNFGVTDSRPVILFLNGEYWGIYFIEEKVDERYLESHYGVDRDNVNIIAQWAELEAGSSDEFYSLYYWLNDADLSDTAQYAYFSGKIDVPNIIDYYLFELFSANRDWPINNVRCWQTPGGPWRWVFYDGDWCLTFADFDVYGNATHIGEMVWPTSGWSTLFMRKLFENTTFKNQFISRIEEVSKKYLTYKRTKPYLDRIRKTLKDEIPQQSHRFNNPKNMAAWEQACSEIDRFLFGRENRFWLETKAFFHLKEDGITSVTGYPNPMRSGSPLNLRIAADDDCTVRVSVYDMNGRYTCGQYCFLLKGDNTVRLNMDFLSGVYIVKAGAFTKKIVVANP